MADMKLYEKIYLLALDEETGRIYKSAKVVLDCALAGALLGDLGLCGKLALDENRQIIAKDETPSGDALMDQTLKQIRTSKKARKAAGWVKILSSDHVHRQVCNQLVKKGQLQREHGHAVSVLRQADQPGASAKYLIKQHLRAVTLGGEAAEQGDALLLSLLRSARLLDLLFTRDELQTGKKVIRESVKVEEFGQAVRKAVKKIARADETG